MQVYNELAFANFYQEFVGDSRDDKHRIDERLIDQSCGALEKMLDVLMPNLVIAWGLGLAKDITKHCQWWGERITPPNGHGLKELDTWAHNAHPYTRLWAINS